MREEKEDVFGGKDAWANADTYPKQCADSECNGMVAAARFVQIRSADEPMTGFYRVSGFFFSSLLWGLAGEVEWEGKGGLWREGELDVREWKWKEADMDTFS